MILQVLTWIEREHNERKGNSFQIIEYGSIHNINERAVKENGSFKLQKNDRQKRRKNYEEHDERISWK